MPKMNEEESKKFSEWLDIPQNSSEKFMLEIDGVEREVYKTSTHYIFYKDDIGRRKKVTFKKYYEINNK